MTTDSAGEPASGADVDAEPASGPAMHFLCNLSLRLGAGLVVLEKRVA